MILALVGSRLHKEEAAVRVRIKQAIRYFKPDLVISGGAIGTDAWAIEIAKAEKVKWVVEKPRGDTWEHFKTRNILIAQRCEALVALVSRTSPTHGAEWTYKHAKSLGKTAYIIRFE